MGILETKKKVSPLKEKFGERDQKKVRAAIKGAKEQSEKQADKRQKENEAAMAKKEKERE